MYNDFIQNVREKMLSKSHLTKSKYLWLDVAYYNHFKPACENRMRQALYCNLTHI